MTALTIEIKLSEDATLVLLGLDKALVALGCAIREHAKSITEADTLTAWLSEMDRLAEIKEGPERTVAPSVERPAAAPPPAGKPDRRRSLTPVSDEQRALLRTEYPAGVKVLAMLPRVNALPGRRFQDTSELSVFCTGHSMLLRRPPGWVAKRNAGGDTLDEARRMYPPAAREAPRTAEPVAGHVAPPAAAKTPRPASGGRGVPFTGLIAGADPFRAQREAQVIEASRGRL